MGKGPHAVDAGIGPDVHQHHLAPELITAERGRIQPHRPFREGRQSAQNGQRTRRKGGRPAPWIDGNLCEQGLLNSIGVRQGEAGQGGLLQAQGDRSDADNHRTPQAPAQPGGGLKGTPQDVGHAPTGEQGNRQAGAGAGGIGQQQQGRAGSRPLQRRAGQHQAQDRTGAGRPQQADRHAQQGG